MRIPFTETSHRAFMCYTEAFDSRWDLSPSPRHHTKCQKIVSKTFFFRRDLSPSAHVLLNRQEIWPSPRPHVEVSRLPQAHLSPGVMPNTSHTISETNTHCQDFIAKPYITPMTPNTVGETFPSHQDFMLIGTSHTDFFIGQTNQRSCRYRQDFLSLPRLLPESSSHPEPDYRWDFSWSPWLPAESFCYPEDSKSPWVSSKPNRPIVS